MRSFDTAATRAALPIDRLIPALRDMLVAVCEVPLRHTHSLPRADGGADTVLIMPAWQPSRYPGIKTVNIIPMNAARGLPGLFSTYVLYEAQTGEPLAQIDGNEIFAAHGCHLGAGGGVHGAYGPSPVGSWQKLRRQPGTGGFPDRAANSAGGVKLQPAAAEVT